MCGVLCTCVCRHVCTEVRGGPAPSNPSYPFEIESFIEPGSYTGILRPIEPEPSVPVHHSTRVTRARANQLFTWVLRAYSRSVLTIFKF